MIVAPVSREPRTERTRAGPGPAAARGWVDPAALPAGPGTRPASAPLGTGPLVPVAGLDALLALQRVDEPGERRRRAVSRGVGLLAGLDALRLALLEGHVPPATLRGLRRGLDELEGSVGDPALDGVLREIAVRVEVELAKLEPRQEGVERSAPGAEDGQR